MSDPARAALLGLWCLGIACASAPPSEEAARLRVGTSGDYAPFSLIEHGEPRGFDLDVAAAYARDRGLQLETVRFRWPELLTGLAGGRFDVAMSGVTVRPDRSIAGRFSVPVARSGAVALVGADSPVLGIEELDAPGRRIAVNAGGHLERVARAHFPRAEIRAIPDNAAVPEALARGEADAIVTDSLEAPRWQTKVTGSRPLGPFTRDRKAYLWRPDLAPAAADLDRWLMAREADGSLARWRRERLGPGAGARTADPLAAFLAALDERLDLMPAVAETKRATGGPVRVPAREARVVEAAQEATRAAATRLGRRVPEPGATEALFRAQIDAAVAIQHETLERAPAANLPPDLDRELRPALLRIGERIAELWVRLPIPLDPTSLRHSAEQELSTPGLEPAAKQQLIEALVTAATAQPPAETR